MCDDDHGEGGGSREWVLLGKSSLDCCAVNKEINLIGNILSLNLVCTYDYVRAGES